MFHDFVCINKYVITGIFCLFQKVCESDLIQSISLRSSDDGDTFLHAAATRKDSAVVLLAMKSKVVMDKNPKNNEGFTPLHCAASRGHFQICGMFIDQIEDKNPKNNLGHTPLHYAAYGGYLEICKLILDNVQDKNPRANDGETPLHFAALNGNLPVVRLIIENNVNKLNPNDSKDAKNNPKNENGITPLHMAASKGYVWIFELIIQNVDEKNPKDNFGRTPIQYADGHKAILRIYMQNL